MAPTASLINRFVRKNEASESSHEVLGDSWTCRRVSDRSDVPGAGRYAERLLRVGATSGKHLARNRREMTSIVRSLFMQKREVYGSPRLTRELQAEGLRYGKNYIASLMRDAGIVAKAGKKKFRHTTDSNHFKPRFSNLLQRRFNISEPNRVWVSDVTFIRTKNGWVYLCVFIDLYSRQVVGWSMKHRNSFELVTDGVKMAIGRRQPAPGLVVHSDQGLHYCGQDYRRILSEHSMHGSMSRKGDCWDNAVAESFFGTLKQELVPKHGFSSRIEARLAVFEFIEVFYNRERMHSTLGFKTPVRFDLAA